MRIKKIAAIILAGERFVRFEFDVNSCVFGDRVSLNGCAGGKVVAGWMF
jgi:hypothetical protein